MGLDSVVVFPFVVAGPLFTRAGLPRSHDVAAGDAVPAWKWGGGAARDVVLPLVRSRPSRSL